MIIPVLGAGAAGLWSPADVPAAEIPLNAWTAARNVRFQDGVAEKFKGHAEVYATPLWAPIWLLPVATSTNFFWLYGSQVKVGATDGNTHADLTRAVGGDYTYDPTVGWTGTIINGIPVINNGVDVPQMWNTPALGTRLTALTAWDANWRAKALRSLKRYLVALDIKKSGIDFHYTVKWSHIAPQGGVPTSWNEADDTIDAGEWDLPDSGGFIVDGFPLRDNLVVYKEFETWLMQYIGGIDIFRFTRPFSSFGALTRRCAAEFFNGKHLVFTGDDVVLHDSQQAQSVADLKIRKSMNTLIDGSNFRTAFLAVNYQAKEVWIGFAEVGSTWPNKAFVWNWAANNWGIRDLPLCAFIGAGPINPTDVTSIWSGATGDWDSDTISWGERTFQPTQRKMLMALPVVTKLMEADSTNQQAGVNMTAYVERESLGFPLKVNQPPDFTTIKQLNGVWPRISGTQGGIINVYVGTQKVIGGPVTWSSARAFTIGVSRYIDCRATGRLHALRFESTTDIEWKLHNYDVDVKVAGRY